MLLGCLLISGCNRHSTEAANAKPAKPIAVIRADTMVVEKQVWPHRVRTQGSFIADEVSSMGAKVPGRVSEVLCDLGDQVELNPPLIKIDAEQYELLVAQAEAQLTQARSAVGLRDGDPLEKLNPENAPPVREAKAVWDEAKQAVERIRRLSFQNAISATDLEVAEAAERVASARFASAQNAVREKIALIGVQSCSSVWRNKTIDTVILCSVHRFGSKSSSRRWDLCSVGTIAASVGQHFATSLSWQPFPNAMLSLPHRSEGSLAVRAEQSACESRISWLSPTLDPLSRALSFEAVVENQDQSLRSGLFAEVSHSRSECDGDRHPDRRDCVLCRRR